MRSMKSPWLSKPQFWLKMFLSLTMITQPLIPITAFAGNGVIEYDVSGKDGQDDYDGSPSYAEGDDAGRSFSKHGDDGDDGGNAKHHPDRDGQNAGSLKLHLSYQDPNTGEQFGISGDKVRPGTRTPVPVNDVYQTGRVSSLRLKAKGGKGGDGGDSGRGQDGGDGARGGPGSHVGKSPVKGTRAGNGGDGGDEGDPTSGAPAGDGGHIETSVSIFEDDLAMFLGAGFNVDVSGNYGGQPGNFLGPGEAGSGGARGRSDRISWEEKTGTEDVYTTRSVKNSKGETVGTERVKTGTRDVFTTRTSTAKGGDPGTDGTRGTPSSKRVYKGADSEDGIYKYVVIDEDGQRHEYDAPYDLILQPTYKLRGDLNNNGFFEPGETIHISGLQVTNNGKAPSPKYQKMVAYVADNSGWIRTNGIELEVPVVLQPGETYTFSEEEISFYLEEKPHNEPGLMQSQDTLAPRARVTRVEQDFRRFNQQAQTSLKIQYPVQITPLYGLHSLAPGEVSKVMFRVKNLSEQTIGKVKGRELREAFVNFQREGGTVDDNNFFIVQNPDQGFEDAEIGFDKAISGLEPGQEMVVEAYVGLSQNAVSYKSVTVQPELHLEKNRSEGTARIQYEPFEIRVTQTFEYNTDSDILLVANNELDKPVLDALKYVAARKNLKMDIWDWSYYGFFNLHHSLAEWENFFTAYRNKTIILMGNEIATPNGERAIQNMLSPDDIIDAARRYGIKFVIMDTSSDYETSVAELTQPVPTTDEEITDDDQLAEFSSVNDYIKELESEVKIFDDVLEGDVEKFVGVSDVELSKRRLWFWGPPKREQSESRAQNLLRLAQAKAPETSLFVDVDHVPVKVGGWFMPKWTLGKLRVSRSVDKSRTSVLSVKVTPQQLADPAFILSDDFLTAFDMGIHLNTKLKLIDKIFSGQFDSTVEVPEQFKDFDRENPMILAQTLINSVLSDIYHEQMVIRPFTFKSKVDKETLNNKLDILSNVANYSFDQTELDPETPAGQMLVRFIGQLKFISKQAVSPWAKVGRVASLFTWKSKNHQVSTVTDELIQRMIEGIFDDSLREEAESAIETVAINFNEDRKVKGTARSNLGTLLDGNESSLANYTNGEVNRDESNRVLSDERQAELRGMEDNRQRMAESVRTAFDEKRGELILPRDECQRLMGEFEKHRNTGNQN